MVLFYFTPKMAYCSTLWNNLTTWSMKVITIPLIRKWNHLSYNLVKGWELSRCDLMARLALVSLHLFYFWFMPHIYIISLHIVCLVSMYSIHSYCVMPPNVTCQHHIIVCYAKCVLMPTMEPIYVSVNTQPCDLVSTNEALG